MWGLWSSHLLAGLSSRLLSNSSASSLGSLILGLLLCGSSKLHISTPSILPRVLLPLFRSGDGIQDLVCARQACPTVPHTLQPPGPALSSCPCFMMPAPTCPMGTLNETKCSFHCFCGCRCVGPALSGQFKFPGAWSH